MFREKSSTGYGGMSTTALSGAGSSTEPGYFKAMHQTMLEKIIEASPAFIYVFDQQQQRFVYASPNMSQMFGYAQDNLTGTASEKIMELVHKEDKEQVLKAEAIFLEAVGHYPSALRREMRSILNFRLTRADGSPVWVQQQKSVLETDANGEPVLIMAVITDINATKKCHEFFSSIVYRNENGHWIELGSEEAGQQLSNRETQILRLLAKGKSSKIIAAELSISVNTVNNHRKNMLLKTGACNIAELVSYGLSHGLI